MSLVVYQNPFVKSTKEILLDSDFAKEVDKLVEIGKKYGIVLSINSGFRSNSNHLQGAIVTPAKKSNHFVGCAIDANVYVNGQFFSSDKMLYRYDSLIGFIKGWETIGGRWGGRFSPTDPVHFDNGLNIHDPKLWAEKYKEYH